MRRARYIVCAVRGWVRILAAREVRDRSWRGARLICAVRRGAEYTVDSDLVRRAPTRKGLTVDMRMHWLAVVTSVIALHCGGVERTTGNDLCTPGHRDPCECGRAKGVRVCAADGVSYGACGC